MEQATLPAGATPHSDRNGQESEMTLFTLGIGGFESDVAFVSGMQCWKGGSGLIAMAMVLDPEEVGLAGVDILVTWQGAAGQVTVTVVNDAFVRWAADSLPAGDYTVGLIPESIPVVMALTTETPAPVAVDSASSANVDAGLALLLAVDSTVWMDRSGEGVVDGNEQGIGNVLVNLYDEEGELVGIAETGPGGGYGFSELLPGVYLIELDRAFVLEGLLATSDRDAIADFATNVDMAEGLDILDAHFGFQTGLPVTGFNIAWFGMWRGSVHDARLWPLNRS